MFIQTEQTPNPATLKFIPGLQVMPRGTAQFDSVETAGASPLAQRLLKIDGVTSVFLGSDFVSVSKAEDQNWSLLKTHILGEIMQHFTSGLPAYEAGEEEISTDEDSEIVTQIKQLLDERIRPAVANDGGDITFVRFEDGVVYLRMQGACAGCPSSTATLKMGIENMLRHYIPEVVSVEPDQGDYNW